MCKQYLFGAYKESIEVLHANKALFKLNQQVSLFVLIFKIFVVYAKHID